MKTVRPGPGWLPRRKRDAHKGDAGHVLVVAGSRGMMGAGRLCAGGALRGGAGRVTWAVPGGEYLTAVLGGPPEAMTFPFSDARKILSFARDKKISSVALGPGLSTAPRSAALARNLLKVLSIPVVADADALNALALRPMIRRGPWVITPHPGEAARLLGTSAARVQSDREGAALALARRFGAVAVLKGAGTVVTNGESIFVNETGNPGMASGGMGDVLAGLITALIPQVAAGSLKEACWRAAVLAVRAHGAAGDRTAREVGAAGFTASELLERIPAALR